MVYGPLTIRMAAVMIDEREALIQQYNQSITS